MYVFRQMYARKPVIYRKVPSKNPLYRARELAYIECSVLPVGWSLLVTPPTYSFVNYRFHYIVASSFYCFLILLDDSSSSTVFHPDGSTLHLFSPFPCSSYLFLFLCFDRLFAYCHTTANLHVSAQKERVCIRIQEVRTRIAYLAGTRTSRVCELICVYKTMNALRRGIAE